METTEFELDLYTDAGRLGRLLSNPNLPEWNSVPNKEILSTLLEVLKELGRENENLTPDTVYSLLQAYLYLEKQGQISVSDLLSKIKNVSVAEEQIQSWEKAARLLNFARNKTLTEKSPITETSLQTFFLATTLY